MNKQLIRIAASFIFLAIYSPRAIAGWVQTGNPVQNASCMTMAINGNAIFVGGGFHGVYRTVNYGVDWTEVNSGLPAEIFLNETSYVYIQSLVVYDNELFCATPFSGVYRSSDNGASWVAAKSGLPVDSTLIYTLAVNGNHLFAGSNKGIFRSDDKGTNWVAANSGLPPKSMVVGIFVNNNGDIFAATVENSLFRSSDNGSTWISVKTGLPVIGCEMWAFCTFEEKLIVSNTNGAGLFESTDNGTTWKAINISGKPINYYFINLVVVGNAILAGTWDGGVFLSTDGGTKWGSVDSGLPIHTIGRSLVVNNSGDIFIGTDTWVYRRPLSEMITVRADAQTATQKNPIKLNIVTSSRIRAPVAIDFSNSRREMVTATVSDILGNTVASLFTSTFEPGMHHYFWSTQHMSPGYHVVKLRAGASVYTKSVLIY